MKARLVGLLFLLLLATSAWAQGRAVGAAGVATQTTITDAVTLQLGYDVATLSPQSSTGGKTGPISPTITGSTFVLISVGDSVISNLASVGYTPVNASAVQNLNLYNGLIYRAVDPLLGNGGTGGSYVTNIGDSLVTAGKFPRVILASVAMPGATTLDWTSGGNLNQRARVICWMIRGLGWIGDANVKFGIIYNAGVNDATAGSTQQQIIDRINAFYTTMTGYGCAFDMFVSIDSRLAGVTSATVTGAQSSGSVIDNLKKFQGINIDSITASGANTADGTHLNQTGNALAGSGYSTLFQAHY